MKYVGLEQIEQWAYASGGPKTTAVTGEGMSELIALIRDMRAFENSALKALTSHRDRDIRFREADEHRSRILQQLDNSQLQDELTKLLSDLDAKTTAESVTAAKREISQHRLEFAEVEASFDQMARLRLWDYLEAADATKSTLSAESVSLYKGSIPTDAKSFKDLFAKMSLAKLEEAKASTELPRKEKRRRKDQIFRDIWRTCTGSAVALGNVILSQGHFGVPPTVSMTSMGIGAMMLGVSGAEVAQLGRLVAPKKESARAERTNGQGRLSKKRAEGTRTAEMPAKRGQPGGGRPTL